MRKQEIGLGWRIGGAALLGAMAAFIFPESLLAPLVGVLVGMTDMGVGLAALGGVCFAIYFVVMYPMILLGLGVVGALVFALMRWNKPPDQTPPVARETTQRIVARPTPKPAALLLSPRTGATKRGARKPGPTGTSPSEPLPPARPKSRVKATARRASSMKTSTPTKADLTGPALELFGRVQERLPTAIAQRLRSNRLFVTHGSYNNLFLFDVWDLHQTDVLDRKHFKYCLGCDLRGNAPHNGYLHLWLNTVRIYRKREEVVAKLSRALSRLRLPGFEHEPHDRAISVVHRFDYPRDLADLPDLLLPHYVTLISAVHPILMPIIDEFSTALRPGERRAVVAKRGRIPFTHPGVRDPERVREYTRSVSPKLRAEILMKHGYRCALCQADLRYTPSHIDHIKAFSKGGTSAPENLQPLCGPCNLAKGNRDL